jgi:hypothetical protein
MGNDMSYQVRDWMLRRQLWQDIEDAIDNGTARTAEDDAVCPICREYLYVPVWHCVGGGHLHAQVRAGIEPEPRMECAAFPDGLERM